MSRTPGNFYLLAICCGLITAGMLVALLSFDHGWSVPVRGMVALLAGLSTLTAEALWNARPWAGRAATTFAVALAAGLALGSADDVGTLLMLLAAGFTIINPAVRYVRAETQRLWPPGAGIAVPAPTPPPPPAGRP